MKPPVRTILPPEDRKTYLAKGLNDGSLAEAALAAWNEAVRTGIVFEGPYHAFVQGYLAAQEDS